MGSNDTREMLIVFLLGFIYAGYAQNVDIIIETIPSNGNLQVVVGENAFLSCKITQGSPTPITVTWTKDGSGSTIHTGEEFKFSPVTLEHAGSYTCRASNGVVDDKIRQFTLTTYDFLSTASFSDENGRIKNTHEATGIKVIWYNSKFMPADEINEGNKVADWIIETRHSNISLSDYDVDNTNGDLLIPKVKLDMEGWYTSLMKDPIGGGDKFAYGKLIVYVAPSDVSLTYDKIVEGEEASLNCTAPSVKPDNVTFEWYFNEVIMSESPELQKSPHSNGTFRVISKVKRKFKRNENKGSLKCTVTHGVDATKSDSDESIIDVMYGPSGAPEIQPKDLVMKVEDEFTLFCNVSIMDKGNPPGGEYKWWKGEDSVLGKNGAEYSYTPGLVTDTGNYYCSLTNDYGDSEKAFTSVKVEAPPFIEDPEDKKVYNPLYDDIDFIVKYNISGSNIISIELKNSSNDDTNKHFVKKQKKIEGDYKYGQTEAQEVTWQWQLDNHRLESCDNVTFFNGDYHIYVQGSAGGEDVQTTSSFKIGVQYPAVWGRAERRESSALGDRKILHCDVCANPAPSGYSWETFHGKNTSGETTANYTIEKVSQEDFGLYTCIVKNTIKQKVYEKIFNITLEEKGSPHEPENFKVNSHTSKSLLLSWDIPFNGGYDLEVFELVINNINNDEQKVVSIPPAAGKAMRYRVTKLIPETEYRLEIRAKNSWTDTARSYSKYVYTKGATSANPDVKLLKPRVTTEALTITWLYTSSNAGDPPVGVVVMYRTAGDENFTRHPTNDSIPAEDQGYVIKGTFDVYAAYNIKFEVYEGDILSNAIESIIQRPVSVNVGAIAGGVVGGLLAILIIGVIVGLIIRHKNQNKHSNEGFTSQSNSRQELNDSRNFNGFSSGSEHRAHHNRPPVATKPLPAPRNAKGNKTRLYENVSPENQSRWNQALDFNEDEPGYARVMTNAHGEDAPITDTYEEICPPNRQGMNKNNQEPPKQEGELLYADLAFEERKRRRKRGPDMVHGAEEKVDYADLDFVRMQNVPPNNGQTFV